MPKTKTVTLRFEHSRIHYFEIRRSSNNHDRFQNFAHKLYKFSIIKNLRILIKNRSEGYQLPTESVHLRDLEQKRWDGFRDFRNLHFRIHE